MPATATPTHIRIPPHIVHRRFETETVILNLQTGQYHGLNGTAAHIFDLLQHHQNTHQTLHHLTQQHPTIPTHQLQQDLHHLTHQLHTRGLIELHD